MKRLLGAAVSLAVALLLAAGSLAMGGVPRAHAQGEPQCTPAPIESDEPDEGMTALIVVQSNETRIVTGLQDASQCDIGVYAAPGAKVIITHAEIVGGPGTAFGVFNNGANVTIKNSNIHGIRGTGQGCGDEDADDGEECGGGGMGGGGGGEGDLGYTGGRHGTAILYTGEGARGTISSTTVSDYGRRGISVSGPGAYAQIAGNTITGEVGGAHGMWRNGVWIANGARATITGNRISMNITGQGISGKASSAIMVAGGPNHNGMPNYTTRVQITGNTLVDNDIGVWLSNGPVLADVPTSNYVSGNTVRAPDFVRQNGAGIKDGGPSAADEGASGGNGDFITGNHAYGYGDKSFVIGPPSINIFARGNTIH